MYPEYILKKSRQRDGLDEDDRSRDDIFNSYSHSEAFDQVCNWEGLINYGSTIRGWVEGIYSVKLS